LEKSTDQPSKIIGGPIKIPVKQCGFTGQVMLGIKIVDFTSHGGQVTLSGITDGFYCRTSNLSPIQSPTSNRTSNLTGLIRLVRIVSSLFWRVFAPKKMAKQRFFTHLQKHRPCQRPAKGGPSKRTGVKVETTHLHSITMGRRRTNRELY